MLFRFSYNDPFFLKLYFLKQTFFLTEIYHSFRMFQVYTQKKRGKIHICAVFFTYIPSFFQKQVFLPYLYGRIQKKKKKDPEEILPIKKFVNWYNPLLRAGIFMSIIITAFKFLSRLITDIRMGLPSSFTEVLIIAVNYLADAVYGFSAYVIAILIFNFLFEKIINWSLLKVKNLLFHSCFRFCCIRLDWLNSLC